MIDSMPSAYIHLTPKARKQHRCCECRGVIEPGEFYHIHQGIWDGVPERYKVCVDCEEMREGLNRGAGYEDMVPLEGLIEEAYEREDTNLMERLIDIRKTRGCESPRMEEYLKKLKESLEALDHE